MFSFLPFLISFLITVLAVPLTIKVARRFDLLDDPSKRPHPAHIQQRIIPRAGGLAIFLGIAITSLLTLPLEKHLVGILAGITVLLLTGLLDDKLRNFSPYWRLILLFIAAGCAVASGIGITFIANPLAIFFPQSEAFIHFDKIVIPVNFLGEHNIILIADIFAFLLIVTLMQVINWSKGVDGQMPGIAFCAALTLGFLSLKLYLQGDPNQLSVASLAFITAGSALGFLIFNWYPSKILPGFSGSTIFAFLLATLAILAGAKVATVLLVLAVPTADFIYTVFRRILNGRSPVWGDRGHLHHRLLDRGWSHQAITLFYIAGSAILGIVSLFIDSRSKFFAMLVAAVVFIIFVLWLNSFGPWLGKSARDNG